MVPSAQGFISFVRFIILNRDINDTVALPFFGDGFLTEGNLWRRNAPEHPRQSNERDLFRQRLVRSEVGIEIKRIDLGNRKTRQPSDWLAGLYQRKKYLALLA